MKSGTPRKQEVGGSASQVAGGNVVNIRDGSVVGQVAGGDIHNHINERKIVRPVIVRGAEFVSPEVAAKIREKVKALVDLECAAGEERAKSFAKWWAVLKAHFGVPSYLEISAAQGDQALAWLDQLRVIQRPRLRRANNTMWRAEHYRGIWGRSKELGMTKADVYSLVFFRLGKQVVSLKTLGERDLKKLYGIIFAMKGPKP